MSLSVNEQMFSAVESARREAAEASLLFDKRSVSIELNSRRSINLYGGSAMETVREIASSSREACDDLYTTFQTLVVVLDKECRPLIEENADISAVYKVYSCIKWLNEESEIKNNFAASLNGYNLGELVKVSYNVSVENKMIQRYWEQAFKLMPKSDQYADAQKAKEKELIKEYERKQEEIWKKFEAEKEELKHKEENKIVETHKKADEKACSEKLKAFDEYADEELKSIRKKLQSDQAELLTALNKKLDELNTQLSKTWFKGRSEIKSEIKKLKIDIEIYSSDEYIEKQYQKCEDKVKNKRAQYKTQLDDFIENKYTFTEQMVLLDNPDKPTENNRTSIPNDFCFIVYKAIEKLGRCRVADIEKELGNKYSNQEIIPAVRLLKDDYIIVRTEDEKYAYFESELAHCVCYEEIASEADISVESIEQPEIVFGKQDYEVSDYVQRMRSEKLSKGWF